MFRYSVLTFLLLMSVPAWDAATAADSEAQATEAKSEPAEKPASFNIIDAGPGFGPRWLSENSLSFAYMEYDVRKKFPFNNLVFTKIRYDGQLGGVNDIVKIPIGNSIMESSAHFVYDADQRQLGYVISNAADRFGSAHGLQVGVVNRDMDKARIYLESPYYLNSGYDEVNGVTMSLDGRSFVVAYTGDLYLIPFGDPGSRDKPKISDIYSDSYLPWFDDSTIGAELIREGHNTRYPVFFTSDELLIYENNDLLLYNLRDKSTHLVVTVGEDVRGIAVARNSKQIAILKDGEIIRYDIAGNELDRLEIGNRKARNLVWNPDGRYMAYDDIEKVYIVELEPNIPTKRGESPVTPVRSIPQVSFSCGSAEKIMEIRRSLEAEINGLHNDVSDTRLIGLHKVSAQLRQLANCQSTIVRGGSGQTVNTLVDESMSTTSRARSEESRTTAEEETATVTSPSENDPLVGSKFQVLEEPGTLESTTQDSEATSKFKVKKPENKSFNKFRDSPDTF